MSAIIFRQGEWPFTGASGTEYLFTILPKSEELPQSPGVFILAYTHPCGHMAGWQVTPVFVGHSDNMRLALDEEVALDSDRMAIWNCNFVLVESVPSAREAVVRDLKIHESKCIRFK